MNELDAVQGGAVVVLAVFVILELRMLRPIMASVKELLAALLERERIRGERKRRESEQPATRARDEHEWPQEETTNLNAIIDRNRRSKAATPRGGVRSPRKGTHHDKDEDE